MSKFTPTVIIFALRRIFDPTAGGLVRMVISIAVAAAARYGLNLDATQIFGIWVALTGFMGTVTHATNVGNAPVVPPAPPAP